MYSHMYFTNVDHSVCQIHRQITVITIIVKQFYIKLYRQFLTCFTSSNCFNTNSFKQSPSANYFFLKSFYIFPCLWEI